MGWKKAAGWEGFLGGWNSPWSPPVTQMHSAAGHTMHIAQRGVACSGRAAGSLCTTPTVVAKGYFGLGGGSGGVPCWRRSAALGATKRERLPPQPHPGSVGKGHASDFQAILTAKFMVRICCCFTAIHFALQNLSLPTSSSAGWEVHFAIISTWGGGSQREGALRTAVPRMATLTPNRMRATAPRLWTRTRAIDGSFRQQAGSPMHARVHVRSCVVSVYELVNE